MTNNKSCIYCGSETQCDCLERINCNKIGKVGHLQCGICNNHKIPRFQCGCIYEKSN